MTSNISYRCSTDTTYWSVITLSVWVEFEFFFFTAPISIGHHLISLSWVWVFLGLHLYQSVIFLSVWVWAFGIAPISINHLLISLSLSFRDRTYIDRSSPCQSKLSLSFFFWTAPISIGHSFSMLVWVQLKFLFHVNLSSVWVFQDRTYIDQSFICLVNSVWVRAAPISIDHFPISLSFETAPILIGHSFFLSVWVEFFGVTPVSINHRLVILSLSFWDHTYIDRSFILSVWDFSFWDRTYIDRSLSMSVWVCVFWNRIYINRSLSY